MGKILTDEEFQKYEKAFSLLETVADDYENYGEVLQDETIAEIITYFLEIDGDINNMVNRDDQADDGIKNCDDKSFPLELQILELKRALRAYDDFSKANDDWVDYRDEEQGAPKFVLDARKLLE